MKRFFVLIIVSLAFLTTALEAFASPDKLRKVRIAAFNFYPTVFQAKDGTIQGFYVDFLNEIAKREGWDVEYVYGSWSDGLARIKANEVDVLTNVAYNPERDKFMDYGVTPLLTVWAELYVPRDSTIESIQAVKGKKIAVMKKDFNAANFRNLVDKFEIPCQVVEYDNFDDVLKAVSSKQVDGGVVNNTVGASKQHEYNVKSSSVIFNPFDIFFTVAEGKNRDILGTLDRYLNEWRKREDSPYHKARQRWSHGTASTIRIIPSWVRSAAIAFVLFLSVAVAFIAILRLQVRRKTSELKAQLNERKIIEDTLLMVNESGASERGLKLLSNITCHLAKTIEADYAFISRLLPGRKRVRTIGLYSLGSEVPDIEYDLRGTPCENIIDGKLCIYPSNIVGLFPNDTFLADVEAEGYAATPLWDSSGNSMGLIGIITRKPLCNEHLVEAILNIVATRSAQELEAMNHLKELELKDFTIENIKDAVYWITSEGKFWEVNSTASTMLGYTKDELLTMSVADIHSTPPFESWFQQWAKVKTEGEYRVETIHRTKDGKEIPVEITVTYFQFNDLEYLCAIARNITERRQSEAASIKMSLQQRSILDNLPMMAWLKDCAGRYEMVNEQFIRSCGMELNDVIGKTDLDLWPNELAVRYIKDDQEVMQTRLKKRIEEPGKDESLSYLTFKSPLTDHEDNIIGTTGVAVDVTELKNAEIDKINLQSQLYQAQKMESVGNLAGGVAHDFNNKLSVILGCTYMASIEDNPSELKNFLEEIRKAAEQSADLTRQLLAFARKQTISPKVLDLNEIVTGMLKMLNRLIGEDINLKWQPAADLWLLKFDPSQVDQILANLCVNARDSIAGDGQITIETGNSVIDNEYCLLHADALPGDYVRLVVSDNGCGMQKETLACIFEPFFTTKETGKGTGLGLATVFGIVKQNNGFINVYSEPGIGTTFTIYIPRYTGNSVHKKTDSIPVPVPVGTETILLVEDELAILNMATLLLSKQGYSVLSANNPREAIRLAKENAGEINLLITDVIMPEINGKELARNLQSLSPQLKCLFMSGYTADAISQHGVLEDGVNFIQKPFSIPELATKVREVIDGK
ncbi:MAG: transporter substrate-binding domain-containing protein [Desulfuromonadaceae bacterium]|nr:transporter substrate-binding domain-containing protein [Desulfuromonadaceae bacterium]MDD2855761.1 transporter substrate-binding domain-containing protein [Desulfuromonadaceae bacterium]